MDINGQRRRGSTNPLDALKDADPERGANELSLDRIPPIFSGHKVLSEFGGLRLDPM